MRTIVRLLGYIRPYKWFFFLSLLSVLAMSALEVVKPLLIKQVIDQVIVDQDIGALPLLVAAILGASLLHAGIFYGGTYVRRFIGERIVYDLRNALYRHLHYLEAAFHDSSRTGELMSRVTSDVHSVRRFMGFGLLMIVRIVARIAFVAGAAFLLSWKLTLLVMSVAPLLYWTVRRFQRQIESAYLAFQKKMASMTATLQENITGVRVVRSFGQEAKEEAKFEKENLGVFERSVDTVRIRANHGPMIEFWSILSRGILLIAGGWFVIQGEITIGTFVAFDNFIGRLMQPFRQLPDLFDMLGESKASGERIFEILDTEPAIPAHKESTTEATASDKGSDKGASSDSFVLQHALPRPEGRVTFENVSFNYRVVGDPKPSDDDVPALDPVAGVPGMGGGRRMGMPRDTTKGRDRRLISGKARELPALSGINLDVRPKETVAIVGPTGSGKSTLLHLLNRTYDPSEGRVLLDGVDLRALPVQHLRRHVAVVPQESFLFSATVYENIAYGKPDASMDEVVVAAKKAQAHDFIMSLPRQYETIIGERGAGLSGGQRQRLTLARAILLQPAILVIDDATSAVDMETEFLILSALREIVQDSTTFIVAQRISTVRHADRIIVLDRGRIVEEGTHEELLKAGGIYRRIYDVQAEAAVNGTELKALRRA